MMRLIQWVKRWLTSPVEDVVGDSFPPAIPPEALRMVHHNARCGGEAPAGVTDPPLRGSLRDRMQRARH